MTATHTAHRAAGDNDTVSDLRTGLGAGSGPGLRDARPPTVDGDAGPAASIVAATRKPGNMHTLDLLRGIAALSVVYYHFGAFGGRLGIPTPASGVGQTGVQLFFVLSGYFIGNSVMAPRSFDGVDFGLNRVFRIVPNYFFSLLLVLLFIDAKPIATVVGLGDIVTHVLFIHGWFSSYRESINAVYWTLSVEFMFYAFMLFAAGAVRNRRGGWLVAGAMVAVAMLYRAALWHGLHGDATSLQYGYKQLPGTFDLFGCGLIVALLLRRRAIRRWAARRPVKVVGLLVSATGLAAALLYYHHADVRGAYWTSAPTFILFPLMFGVPAGGVVMFFQQFEGGIGPWLDRSRLAFLGVISYSIYLYHLVVMTTFSHGRTRSSDVPPWCYALVEFAAIIAISTACYLLVEKPFMDRRARMRAEAARSP